MITVMVVEDEPPILRSICNFIEAVNSEFKVTAMADNGLDALKLLEANVPDVIFTDIQMSVIDGLELIKHIRHKKLDIIVVILSGYSDFNYARTALSLGVEDYLLKPINKEDLFVLLNSISNKINFRNSKIKRNLIASFLENSVDSTNVNSYISQKESYVLLLLCAGSFPISSLDYSSIRRSFWNKTKLENMILQILKNNENCWVFEGSTGAERIAVITLQNNLSERLDNITGFLIEKLKNPHFHVNISISPSTCKIEDICGLLLRLRAQLNKESIFAQSNIFNHIHDSKKSENLKVNVPILDPLFKKRILQYMENGAIFSFKKDFANLLSHWEESHFLQIWIEKLLKELIFIGSAQPDISYLFNNIDIEFQIDEAIAVSNSYDELFLNVWFIFQEIFNEQLKYDDFDTSTEALIKKIEYYITCNFTEAINNQLLSEKFGLVPSYLSKLFRKYIGMSPSDYISHLRIEKAKEIIKNDSEILGRDIAIIIGFSDPFHFSKVFKRETGMSPKEYKRFIDHS